MNFKKHKTYKQISEFNTQTNIDSFNPKIVSY